MDCVKKVREFILENAIAIEEELVAIEEKAKDYARSCKQEAWTKFLTPIKEQISQMATLGQQLVYEGGSHAQQIATLLQELNSIKEPIRKDVLRTAQRILKLNNTNSQATRNLRNFYDQLKADAADKFNSGLHSTSAQAVSNIKVVAPQYSDNSPVLN